MAGHVGDGDRQHPAGGDHRAALVGPQEAIESRDLLGSIQLAQADVRSTENALTGAVQRRDQLVLAGLDSGLSVGSLARALKLDRRVVVAIKARAAAAKCQADRRAEADISRARKQAEAATSWLSIAVQQVERAEAAEVDGMTDGMLAVLAAHVATVCAIGALGSSHPAVADYLGDGQSGHEALKNSRDLMAHFDKYVEGDGNMQRAKVEGVRIPNPIDARPPLLPMWSGGPSQQLAFLTKTWVRDERGEYLLWDGKPVRNDDGTPQMEPLNISLDLRDALSATAALVAIARKDAQLTEDEAVRALFNRAGI